MRDLKHNLDYLITGLTALAIGLILIHDRNYFFWPPQWAPYFNSYWLGAIGSLSGLGLFIYGLLDHHNDWMAGFLLAVTAGFMGVLLSAEIMPAIGIGYFHWHVGTILLASEILNIVKIALLREPSKRKNKKRTY